MRGPWGVALAGQHIGEAGTVESLTALIAELQTSDVLQTTSKLFMALEAVSTGGVLGVQERLVTELYPEPLRDHLLQLLQRGPAGGGFDVAFYPQQLSALQKVALAVGQPGPPSSFDEHAKWGRFLIAAAQVADVIQLFSSFPVGAELAVAGVARDRPLATFMLRNAAANRVTFYKAVAGRSYRMWFDSAVPWPGDVESAEDYAQRRFGMPLGKFVAIALTPALARIDLADGDPERSVFDPSAYFKNTSATQAEASAVLDALAYPERLPPQAVREAGTYWNATDLAERPYLRSSSTTLIPSSVSRAFERSTTGIFWLLHQAIREKGDVTPLTNHFGLVFEDYCLRLLTSVASLTMRVGGQQSYARSGSTVKTVDALISCLGTASPCRIFVEVAALRPRQGLYEAGREEDLDAYLERLDQEMHQLDRSIRDHRQGLFEIADDLCGADDACVPFLVVDEPFQWSVHLRNLVDQNNPEVGGGLRAGVTRPVICSVSELEHLCFLIERGNSLADLLRGYLSETDRALPMEFHLYQRYGQLDAPRFVADGLTRLSELLIEHLRF